MFKVSSEKDLLDSFRDLERGEVELPSQVRFPLLVKDYLSWPDASGHRVFAVFADPELDSRKPPMGVVFRRDTSGSESPPMMCEFCHSVRSGNGVTLLTAIASDRKKVGLHLCRDLSCQAKIESAPGASDFEGLVTSRERARRITRRMVEFARRALF